MSSLQVQEDTMTETLLQQPLKLVFRFKRVCMKWLETITAPWFSKQCQSHHPPSELSAFFHLSQHDHIRLYQDSHQLKSSLMITNLLPHKSIESIAVSNCGLLLINTNDGWEFLFNSITGDLFRIPDFPDWAHGVGIIYQEPHVHLVFACNALVKLNGIMFIRDHFCCNKYMRFLTFSSKTNQWTNLDCELPIGVCFYSVETVGVAIRDTLYWMTRTGDVLTYRAIGDGEAEMINGPPEREGSLGKVLRSGSNDSLNYCWNNKYEAKIWVLSDVVEKSWRLKYKISLSDIFPEVPLKISYLCEGEEIMFILLSKGMVRFGINDRKMELIYTTESVSTTRDVVLPYLIPSQPPSLVGLEPMSISSL
ncbi:hypothetical protein IHE45_04G093200 [Dioscorea alata]|uniref:Uncharacterized protein n=1 Tax=Dioscorea alata TaxID=55571 RepID=A0ACB7WEB9_DIOAL|nr:hypothetical protein IHE45_04G093200 [Dioscorea alata]